MRTVNIHEAKTHLSRLIDAAMKGESFIIAKAGRPMVRVSPITAPEEQQQRRLGFLAGKIRVPEDFDRMGQNDIVSLFDGPAMRHEASSGYPSAALGSRRA